MNVYCSEAIINLWILSALNICIQMLGMNGKSKRGRQPPPPPPQL